MEQITPNEEKIQGRLCAMGRAKYSDDAINGKGYKFTKGGFHWELDPLDVTQYGLTADALNDCIDQLDQMGTSEELKKSDHIRQHQGWMNTGLVITSKIDPRIVMAVTLVDQQYEDADVNLRWFVDLDGVSPAARGPAERSVDAEELKSVERAQAMTKLESFEELFDLPIKDLSSAKKVMSEGTDVWGMPVFEDVESGVTGHVGIDAIEKPHSKEGDKDREEVSGVGKVKEKLAEPEDDPAKREKVDGKGQPQVGGADKATALPDSKIKPGEPEDVPKHVGENVDDGVTGHVGIDAIEKPHSEEGDKDREEVDGEGKVKIKLATPEEKPEERKKVDGSDQPQVGGADKMDALPDSKVKPGEPEEAAKLMAERTKIRESRMKQYEAYSTKKKALAEAKKKSDKVKETAEKIQESKALSEDVKHPLKVIEGLKKHAEEAHRSIKKAHHLTDWAHKKMQECCDALPVPHADEVKAHHGKMEEAKAHMHEARKLMGEVCESVSGIHMHMKKK